MLLNRSVLILLLAALTACATTSASAPPPANTAGSALASDFVLRDSQGQDVRLSDFNGKVVLLDFWQTWCIPCAAELPHLETMYEKLKDKGFVVVGISMDGPETVAQVAPFAQRYGLTFPVLLDEETKVTGHYNPARSAPLTILIDRAGRIYRTREGYDAGDEKLVEADAEKLIAQ